MNKPKGAPGQRKKANEKGFKKLISRISILTFLILSLICPLQKVIPNGLVGYWKFDNNANDDTGLGHHGILFYGPTYTEGKSNKCLAFDGDNDYVLISNIDGRLTLKNAVTIEAWIKGHHFGSGYHHIFDKYGSYSLSIKNRKLAMSGPGGWWHPDSTTLQKDKWYHVVGTYDGSMQKLYINGVLNASRTRHGDLRPGYCIYISHFYYSFAGLIDEVKVYGRALSNLEVLQHYQTSMK
jgi:hypothetical protein